MQSARREAGAQVFGKLDAETVELRQLEAARGAQRLDLVEEVTRDVGRVFGAQAELDDAQVARLLEIADRCPVHRTLMGEKQIKTRLA